MSPVPKKRRGGPPRRSIAALSGFRPIGAEARPGDDKAITAVGNIACYHAETLRVAQARACGQFQPNILQKFAGSYGRTGKLGGTALTGWLAQRFYRDEGHVLHGRPLRLELDLVRPATPCQDTSLNLHYSWAPGQDASGTGVGRRLLTVELCEGQAYLRTEAGSPIMGFGNITFMRGVAEALMEDAQTLRAALLAPDRNLLQ